MAAPLDHSGFVELMQRLARAWGDQDTEAGLSCFAEDAVYMEPPDIQLYVGRDQLRPYFGALEPGTTMEWHRLWFDADSQSGAGEYTFAFEGAAGADHGVAVVELRDGMIARWREYQRKGPPAFEAFTAVEGKRWEWTIENYP
jgi:ketosteroid isomerase-like protein